MERISHEVLEVTDSFVRKQIAVATFISVLFVVPVLWMLMDRSPPYVYEKVEIEPQDVIQGGDIYITFTVKETRPACGAAMVYREFKEASGKLHIYDPIKRIETPHLIDKKFSRISKIPDNLTPGIVTYRATACYTCNPIHSWLRWPVCVSTPDIEFNVLKNGGERDSR